MIWILYAIIPFLGAAIGWVTNWVAIKMLFRPRTPRSFGGWKWQGLIPRRQKDLASKTAEILDRELVTQDWLEERLTKADIASLMKEFTSDLIRQRFAPRLKSLPLIGSFLNDSTIASLEKVALEEMDKEAASVSRRLGQSLPSQLKIRELMEERILAFETERLEAIVHEVAQKEFKTIERLGAVLGFTIGCIQLALLALIKAL